MTDLLIVTSTPDAFSEFTQALSSRSDIRLVQADSGAHALGMIPEKRFDLVVIDETLGDMTGLAFTEKLVKRNPMLNLALVSALPEKKFHEASEGLGVLAQLTPRPNGSEADRLMEQLDMITKQLVR
ncbi:MAG: response regulator [Desulfobacterales bacterium]|jgi:DNA-binding NtrC family response regulator|nr:response regulator [Desulfobacterales bacterium]